MAALLFIPVAGSGEFARRVDLAGIAGLFAEVEEPQRPTRRHRILRVFAAVLLFLLAFGDTLLVARPGILTAANRPASPIRTVSL